MNYCSHCASPVTLRVPDGDNRERHVCDHCGQIHYQNPRIIAGCLPVHGDRVLLCRRAIEPRYGYWTLPAGFMENGESTEAAALRETLEETCAVVELRKLYTQTSILHVNQVQLIYLADLPKAEFGSSNETLESRLFSEDEIPWDQLAFTTIRNALRYYFADRAAAQPVFPLRHITLTPEQDELVLIN
ncbi:MAG: NUDIX hydrolase [Oceanospirillales bacterium]|uniref:ADP-ribose pyrophosphatase YjhB (NUDIX family) n=1 Tax=Marinobacterium halophilum TaxID=267374 RepID=A0A2P8ETA7_9GAMM|nr:NUDIX hydrolase [Marinobacterium halophilum]MBR9827805.1 NUDIX hydrolase [Oceanospirillales bacterium]PSL12682.1 ADP-ribose pyrophosphatase YjhB (NUDIX family) [Marinobacterium halophilum]